MSRRVLLVGIGPGDPRQITVEAIDALRAAEVVVVTEKHRPEGDPLAAARSVLIDLYRDTSPRVVVVDDPDRDRDARTTSDDGGYQRAVQAWHDARAARYEQVLVDETGDAVFLVWGDPALYDSAIRILGPVADRIGAELVVIPGVSSVSALAARHRIVLHGVGEPVLLTTGRRLAESTGQHDSIAVLLNRSLRELHDLDGSGWHIWWGANLGTQHERLVAGVLADVLAEIEDRRRAVKDDAGWVMDLYLLRRRA